MYFNAIANVIAERTDCDVAIIKPESTFAELGIDSLDTVELLMSLEDEIGEEIELDQKVETVDDLNNTSMIVRVTVSGKTTMLLGDALSGAASLLTATYGSYLKSDMVQLAHHGTNPGTESLYANINAPILFWPSATVNVKDKYNKADHASLRKAISVAKDVYLASDGSKTLTIPCTIVNNKASFLSRMGF
jgi:acyl carrier protein